tara:strand:- start:337 stop:543 length:207 start_codon:yes stop_codon:yes gene_type:complete
VFNVGDYVYARIAMGFDYSSKSDIYHGIIIEIINIDNFGETFYDILDQNGNISTFSETNVFDSIDKLI